MNSQFLGDAYDHWKGSLFCILKKDKAIGSDFAADPMLTSKWKEDDLQTYRRLLHLGKANTILHEGEPFVHYRRRRQEYFQDIPPGRDLFLDPDTGISRNGNGGPKHIALKEVGQLLNMKKDRVLMIYQHHPRITDFRDWFGGIAGALRGARCCVYEGSQVAMLLVSQKKSRIEAICGTLRAYLQGTAQNNRVYCLE